MADEQNIQNLGTEDDSEQLTKSAWPFDRLPTEIRDWLLSDTVSAIVDRFNSQYQQRSLDSRAIGQTITRLAIRTIKPEGFIKECVDRFGAPLDVATEASRDVLKEILTPIKVAMRTKLGIDVDKITTPPVVPAAPAAPAPAPQPTPAPSAPAPITPVPVRSQTTILSKPLVADIRKPALPAEPAKPKNLSEIETTEVRKPFGFIETQPQPPAPHEITPYKDEHPVVE